jgi:ClpP class serine protease
MPREMRLSCRCFSKFALSAVLTGLAHIFGGSSGHALQYQRLPLDPPAILILLRGPIIPGDFDRFVDFLRAVPSTDRITAFALDSPGGNVVEAEAMAKLL